MGPIELYQVIRALAVSTHKYLGSCLAGCKHSVAYTSNIDSVNSSDTPFLSPRGRAGPGLVLAEKFANKNPVRGQPLRTVLLLSFGKTPTRSLPVRCLAGKPNPLPRINRLTDRKRNIHESAQNSETLNTDGLQIWSKGIIKTLLQNRF